MPDTPRRRLPLPMDDTDERTLARTAERGGLQPSQPAAARATPTADAEASVTRVAPSHAAERASNERSAGSPEEVFSRNDLRPQIGQTSALAAALTEVFANLDPVARKYVKPASVLKDFFAENDAELARLFRNANTLK